MQYIGKLDRHKIGEHGKNIVTEDVILTGERIKHIKEHHQGDYEQYGRYAKMIIEDPDCVLEDNKNRDTVLYIKTIKESNKNVQVVIKLSTNQEEKDKQNSILTLWKIKDSTYRQCLRNKKILWTKLDKIE